MPSVVGELDCALLACERLHTLVPPDYRVIAGAPHNVYNAAVDDFLTRTLRGAPAATGRGA